MGVDDARQQHCAAAVGSGLASLRHVAGHVAGAHQGYGFTFYDHIAAIAEVVVHYDCVVQ